ncbi:unnamed protein product [Staurois parvus]|uniref:Uncharacterized protein n=1 Tax=Staurois parvus TaxID=386267 RepID=A0ABN9DTQ2_9NEOB|nr:unnamed protein product [Staurois parvus]
MEYSNTHINFLDTTVYIRDDTRHTSIYRKPTDRCNYLHSSSLPPPTHETFHHTQSVLDTTEYVHSKTEGKSLRTRKTPSIRKVTRTKLSTPA